MIQHVQQPVTITFTVVLCFVQVSSCQEWIEEDPMGCCTAGEGLSGQAGLYGSAQYISLLNERD